MENRLTEVKVIPLPAATGATLASRSAARTAAMRLVSVDALRGLAASVVTLGHALFTNLLVFPALNSTFGFLFLLATPIVRYGYTGVFLFFVISGFCIHLRWAKAKSAGLAQPKVDFGPFWKRRIRRLYPAYLVALALYACVHLKLRGFSWRHILLCGSAIVLLLPFRFYAAYLAAAAALLALTLPQLRKGRSSIFAGVAIAALVIPLAISSGILVRSEAQIERFDLNSIRAFHRNIANGSGSGVTTNYDFNSPIGVVTGAAIGAAHLLLAPFPWQLGGASLRMLLTLPEVLVWWWLVFFGLLPGLWLAIRKRFSEIQPMLIFIAGLGLLYSMLFGNVGLIVRQRAQLLPWLLIFALVGLEQRRLKRALKQQAINNPHSYASAPQRITRSSLGVEV